MHQTKKKDVFAKVPYFLFRMPYKIRKMPKAVDLPRKGNPKEEKRGAIIDSTTWPSDCAGGFIKTSHYDIALQMRTPGSHEGEW